MSEVLAAAQRPLVEGGEVGEQHGPPGPEDLATCSLGPPPRTLCAP